MRIGRLSSLILTASFFFSIPAVEAAQIENFGNQLTAHQGDSLYRLKSTTRPWQLVNLPTGKIVSEFVFSNRLLVVIQQGTYYQLWTSLNGLGFSQTGLVSSAPLGNIILNNQLLVFEQEVTSGSYWVSHDGLNFSFNLSTFISPLKAENFFSQSSKIYYLDANETTAVTYRLGGDRFLPIASNPCGKARLVTVPSTALLCESSRLLVFDPVTSWTVRVSNLSLFTNSETTMAALKSISPSTLVVIQDGRLTEYDLTGLVSTPPSALKLSGYRIFIQTNLNQWAELGYQPCCRVESFIPGEFRIISNDLYFEVAGSIFFSSKVGEYQSVVNAGPFDHVLPTEDGYLAWQAGGSLSQIASDGLNFTKLTTTWATAAKIYTVSCDEHDCWAWVINTSNNYNLYQLESGATGWKRITLPTKPTYALPLSEVRLLPVASLVEVTAPISVPRGVVATDVIYLEDATGGIQVYLSSSKGQINQPRGTLVTATGEISSSRAKRILLSTLTDLEVANEQVLLSNPTVNLKTALENLGRVQQLTGLTSAPSETYLTLSDETASLKVHFSAIEDAWKNASRIALPALVDWSSSSSQTEAWYLGAGLTVVSQAPEPAESTQVVSSVKKTTASKSKSSSGATTASKIMASNAKPKTSALVSDAKTIPAKSQPASDNPTSNQTPLTNVAGLLAGLVISRGFRLKTWLLGS